MKFKHIILDRDGVLNHEVGYILSINQFEWLPGSLEGLYNLYNCGFSLSIATNQSCIDKGLLNLKNLNLIHNKIKNDVLNFGILFSDIEFCPHKTEYNCNCKKPKTGLLERIIEKNNLSKNEVLFIGDSITDFETSKNIDVKFNLVRTGKGKTTGDYLKSKNLIEDCNIFDNLFCLSKFYRKGLNNEK